MDVLKALGILAVILAHSMPPPVVVSVVSTYYIAVFFFVSGYFYNDSYSDDLRLFARKRFRPLYVSFIAWNLGYLVLHNFFLRASILSTRTGYLGDVSRLFLPSDTLHIAFGIFTLRATEQLAGALWFLISLMTATALFALVSHLTNRLRKLSELIRAIVVVALFAAGYLNQHFLAWPAFINTSLVAVSIIYAGFLFRRYEAAVPLSGLLAAVAAVVVFVGRGSVNLGANSYSSLLAFVLVLAAGIYANLYVAVRLRWNGLLKYLGRNTIFVIATHFLAFKLVSLVHVRVHGLPAFTLAKFPVVSGDGGWWVAYFLVGVFVPLGVKTVIDRLRPRAREARRVEEQPLERAA